MESPTNIFYFNDIIENIRARREAEPINIRAPWKIQRSRGFPDIFCVVNSLGEEVDTICTRGGTPSQRAVLRLIAAAPKLLSAAHHAIAVLESQPMTALQGQLYELLHSVIAEVEGR